MAKRFDVCSPRPRKDSDKPYWHRVGTAFEGEKGMNIVFDSLPMPDKEGRCSVFLFESKPKDGTVSAAALDDGGNVKPRRATKDDMEDEIPF